jgi:predicted regulator of Ras-like GTPase activity (Roadblock/LC7/MglB family)
MGVPSSAGPQRPDRARRSIRAIFAVTVAAPVACLVLLWATAAGIMLGHALARRGPWSPSHHELIDLTLLVGAGLAVILSSVILVGAFARRIFRDVSGLAGAAQQFAGEQLPLLLDQLRSADQPAVPAGISLPREDTERLSALAAAVHSLASGAGQQLAVGEVRQTIIELEQALLFVSSTGHGSCLAVLCPVDANAGQVAYEMAMLVKRAGPYLEARPPFPSAQVPVD